MTPQEEEMLVQIIVQCVRAVLEAARAEQEAPSAQSEPVQGSRFIDVVPRQRTSNTLRNGGQNGHGREQRDDVRESLRRFLRDSEPVAPEKAQAQPAQGQPQKRQLITREEVLAAVKQGTKVIALQPDAVVTPLARQVAKEKGVELR